MYSSKTILAEVYRLTEDLYKRMRGVEDRCRRSENALGIQPVLPKDATGDWFNAASLNRMWTDVWSDVTKPSLTDRVGTLEQDIQRLLEYLQVTRHNPTCKPPTLVKKSKRAKQ